MAISTESLESVASLAPENPESLLIGQDSAITQIAHHAERAAHVECTVLITGETGTGKEVWARLLHRLGPRSTKPFVPVNCAALTATLAESQLFGHEKGAFTGCLGGEPGRIPQCPRRRGLPRRGRRYASGTSAQAVAGLAGG